MVPAPRPVRRLLSRLSFWLRALRAFRGLKLGSELNLWVSALADTLFYTMAGSACNARLMLSGLHFYRVRGLGLAVVRGGTDDLYNLLPGREGDVEEFIRSRLAEGSVFVDVGANVGYYALLASKLVGPSGRVHAVEPVPSTAVILRANVRLNSCGNVRVHEVAAWSARGRVMLNIPVSSYGLASATRGRSSGAVTVTARAAPLDEVMSGEGAVDLVKIDVEGAELEVVRGARSTLRKTQYVVLELSHRAREVLKELREAGFECRKARFTSYILCRRSGLKA